MFVRRSSFVVVRRWSFVVGRSSLVVRHRWSLVVGRSSLVVRRSPSLVVGRWSFVMRSLVVYDSFVRRLLLVRWLAVIGRWLFVIRWLLFLGRHHCGRCYCAAIVAKICVVSSSSLPLFLLWSRVSCTFGAHTISTLNAHLVSVAEVESTERIQCACHSLWL